MAQAFETIHHKIWNEFFCFEWSLWYCDCEINDPVDDVYWEILVGIMNCNRKKLDHKPLASKVNSKIFELADWVQNPKRVDSDLGWFLVRDEID